MPEISNFYGINIKMFYKPKEHEPAHIHVFHGSHVGIYDIDTFELLGGSLPVRAKELTKEWMKIHQDMLEGMWDMQVLRQLPPLKLNQKTHEDSKNQEGCGRTGLRPAGSI